MTSAINRVSIKMQGQRLRSHFGVHSFPHPLKDPGNPSAFGDFRHHPEGHVDMPFSRRCLNQAEEGKKPFRDMQEAKMVFLGNLGALWLDVVEQGGQEGYTI
jgi:hypothetical protein